MKAHPFCIYCFSFPVVAMLAVLAPVTPAAAQAPGTLDTLNANVVANSFKSVRATAVQPDGKIIIAGDFTSVQGVPRGNIARLNADGSLDMGFNPKADNTVYAVAVQADGKILLGGSFLTLQPNGAATETTRYFIARVNADGSLDTGFDPHANDYVSSVAVQADGKILLAGRFVYLQPNGAATETTRNYIARVNASGSLDTGFDPNANWIVSSVAVQADNKILLGGTFTTLQPNGAATESARNYIARVNANGSLDAGFNPNADYWVSSLAVQADGKILLGGFFSRLQPNGAASATTRNRVARINTGGSLDTGFNPKANDAVNSVAVQADGKILLGGFFTTLQPNGAATATMRNRVARVNADGSLDTAFDPKANAWVYSVAVQADGKILLGGEFSSLQPNGAMTASPRSLFARLWNDAATQTLSAPDPTRVLWQRGGASPEVSQVTFEKSTNGGATFTSLGNGTRVGTTADWHLTGLTLPDSGQIRARGSTTNGEGNGGAGLVESVLSLNATAAPMQAWNQIWFGNSSGTGTAAPGADPNYNGIPNLVEYALGGDPVGTPTGTSILPSATMNPASGRMELVFSRYPGRNDITLIIQTAIDLAGGWEDFAISTNGTPFTLLRVGYGVVETGTGTARAVTISDTPAAGALHHFMRVKVTVP